VNVKSPFSSLMQKFDPSRIVIAISAPPSDAAELLGREHQARGRTHSKPMLNEALARGRVGSGAA
jgi:hypothetical protein